MNNDTDRRDDNDGRDSVCCPYLAIVECADTDQHSHPVCADSKDAIPNATVRDICIGNFDKCVLRGGRQ